VVDLSRSVLQNTNLVLRDKRSLLAAAHMGYLGGILSRKKKSSSGRLELPTSRYIYNYSVLAKGRFGGTTRELGRPKLGRAGRDEGRRLTSRRREGIETSMRDGENGPVELNS